MTDSQETGQATSKELYSILFEMMDCSQMKQLLKDGLNGQEGVGTHDPADWSARCAAPISVHDVMMVNEREFMVYGDTELYKYNTDRDEWSHVMKLPAICNELDGRKMVFNPETNYLYVSGVDTDIVIDIKQCAVVQQINSGKRWPLIQGWATMVNANGIIHKVGGSESKIHYIWKWTKNIETAAGHDLELLDKAKQDSLRYPKGTVASTLEPFPHLEVANATMIYVKSKNIILMLGGYDSYFHHINPKNNGRSPSTNIASLFTGTFSDDQYDYSHGPTGIWRYRIDTGKWDHIDYIDFNLSRSCKVVLSSDEQHLVIFGGQYLSYVPHPMKAMEINNNWIHVLDISKEQRYKLRRSSIVTASKTAAVARIGGISDSKRLASGWIRRAVATPEFSTLAEIPIVIQMTIGRWCCTEKLHWIGQGDNNEANHMVIPISKILQAKEATSLQEWDQIRAAKLRKRLAFLQAFDSLTDEEKRKGQLLHFT